MTPAGITKLLLALVASLYLAWWVVRISVVAAEVDDNPYLAARADPGNPRVLAELAMAEFYLRQGRVTAPTEAAAIDSLARAPLADEPFLLAGVAALARGDAVGGQALLVEARRRNPRLRLARLLLLDRYLREGRMNEASEEMAVLDRLVVGADTVLIPALAKMTLDRATSGEMIRILQRQMNLRSAVLGQLATSGADPDLILRIAGKRPGSDAADLAWQRDLVANLVAKGDFGHAFDVWKTVSGKAGNQREKGLYDGGFQGRPGPPPFNWDLLTGPLGVAERARGGLQVDYYGREEGDLASQVLMLPAGAYRLQFRAEGDARGDSSRLLWTVSCAAANTSLLQLPVTGVSSAPKVLAARFVVPAGCGAQWLRLHGKPGDIAGEQSVRISALSLAPEAAR